MNPRRTPNKKQTGAGVIGAGLGSIYLYIVTNLKPEFPFKDALVLGAPSATIAVSALSYLCIREGKAAWIEFRLSRRHAKATALLRAHINDKTTTSEHRNQMIKKMEEIQGSEIDNQIEQIKALNDSLKKLKD